MDLTTSGLAGTNDKFNNILKKIDLTETEVYTVKHRLFFNL